MNFNHAPNYYQFRKFTSGTCMADIHDSNHIFRTNWIPEDALQGNHSDLHTVLNIIGSARHQSLATLAGHCLSSSSTAWQLRLTGNGRLPRTQSLHTITDNSDI